MTAVEGVRGRVVVEARELMGRREQIMKGLIDRSILPCCVDGAEVAIEMLSWSKGPRRLLSTVVQAKYQGPEGALLF